MTTDIAPYRSELPVGRDGFAQLLRAEFTKFRTVRAWVITLGVAAVLIVVFAWVGSQQHSGTCTMGSNGAPSLQRQRSPSRSGRTGGEPVVDTFSFLHQPLIGNGSLTAQVTSLTETIASGNGSATGSVGEPPRIPLVPWAKAGIIIKENTTQGSAYAAVMVTPSHGVRMQYDYIHDTAGLPGTVSASSPRWLRLTRAGDLITGYDSLDGTHWTKIGTVHLTGLRDSVQAGLFVTSPAEDSAPTVRLCPRGATLATATFDQVHLSGDFPNDSWTSQVVGANTQTYLTQSTGAELVPAGPTARSPSAAPVTSPPKSPEEPWEAAATRRACWLAGPSDSSR